MKKDDREVFIKNDRSSASSRRKKRNFIRAYDSLPDQKFSTMECMLGMGVICGFREVWEYFLAVV